MPELDQLHLARNRVRAAVICGWLAVLLAGWAVTAIDNVAEERDAAEACTDHPPVIDEMYARGFRDGLQEARAACEAAGDI